MDGSWIDLQNPDLFVFFRIGVIAAVLSEIGTVEEMKDKLMRCEIRAKITGVQCFRRNVGAGSSRLEEEFSFCIKSAIRDGFVKVKAVNDWVDGVCSQLEIVDSSPKVPNKTSNFP